MKKWSNIDEMVELILHIDECVKRWEYTSIYAGTSSVFALFLVFLKCMDDRVHRETESLFEVLARSVENEDDCFDNKYLQDLCNKITDNLSENHQVLELFIKRIDLEKKTKSFKNVLDMLRKVDFKKDKKVWELIEAIQLLYGDVHSGLKISREDKTTRALIMTLARTMLKTGENCEIYSFLCGTGVLLSLVVDRGSTIYAQEPDLEKAIIIYVLLRLESEKVEKLSFDIQIGDVLEQTMTYQMPDKQFDRIVVELPLGKRKSIANKLSISENMEEFLFPDHSNDTGAWLYVRHVLKKLKKHGRSVVITGISELSREGSSRRDRESLLMYGAIDTVIQLPSYGLTGVKTCMIVLQVKSDRKEIYMVDMSNYDKLRKKEDCFDDSESADIGYDQIIGSISEKIEQKGISRYVSYGEIWEQEVNLTPAIYLRTLDRLFTKKTDLRALLEEDERLCRKYDECDRRYAQAVKDYCNLNG